VLEAVANEYSFWEGFDRALDSLSLSEKKRVALANEAEKEREYKRPDDYLYDTAIGVHSFAIFQAMTSFINMRDVSKGITGYEEAEKEYFSDENQNYMLSKAKSEKTEAEVNSFIISLKGFKADYDSFNQAADLSGEEDALKKKLTAEAMRDLLAWFGKSSK
jgi:hypothetical protein